MLKKDEVELSVSSYDTAWVAMVPSQNSSKQPLFPQCLNWIMENQQPDGSWAFDPAHPLLIKDSLSSTLACLLALHKWNVGDKLVHKVPTIYPLNIHPRLYMIDNLAKLGIDGHFTEVDYALKHPYAIWKELKADLERIESRHYIENYSVDDISLLKTSYRYFNIDNRDLLMLSFQDFNKCQAIYRKEMEYLERWVEENSFKNLKFARQKIAYSYFSIAAVLSHPHLSDARISWAQMSVLVTIVDDFFDLGGSMEELLNLIELVHRWDDHSTIGFKSKDVEILFYSIYGTTNDIADKARKQQGRCVRKHLIDIWINLLDTMLKEAEWARNKLVPTMYEYITNGYVSFGLGPIILTSLYFLGFKLSEQVVETKEYNNLFMHLSMIGRLLNDRASIKREGAQGKLNSVSLTIEHDRGAITEKEAQEEVARLVESHRRELLRMVQQTKRSVVPKSCKDMFWKTSKTLHLFYLDDDGYSSPHKMVSAVNAVINEPIFLPPYSKLD
ncbi:hypothetical protein GH714_032784 [Hevea brasiliensis]|uniref:Terpene synthase metal-binding domain-containing protein n=1 Tax=Hevea brasiliensis TaxID=3981 RepID=A0A6A6LVH0_HEVBR|nr:hypothetical protein GH714_032784 [Hevea brasiliensis]